MSSYTPTYGLSSRLTAQNTQRLNTINQISDELNATLNQLSTGYKFTSAAENPSGSTELTRLQAKIYGVESAISNNQLSIGFLSGADSAQSEILNTLMDMRSKVYDATTNSSDIVKETVLGYVSAGISAVNVLSNSITIGNKNVLAGDAEFDLDPAENILSTDNSYIRSMLNNTYFSMSFDKDNATEQGVISGTFNLPDSGLGDADSVFDITCGSRTKRIQINAVNPVDSTAKASAISQMNEELADIGVYAEMSNDGTQLFFLTKEYGADADISYSHVSGTDILNGLGSATDSGETGTVLINGKKYDLKGNYSNDGSESAQVSGAFTDSIATDATITLATATGSASYALAGGDTISGSLSAINTAFAAIGVKAEISDGELSFSTIEKGASQALVYSNTGTDQIFTDGLNFTATGKDYEENSGIQTYISNTDFQAKLNFSADKVGSDLVNGTALEDQRYSFQPEGGVHFQISDGTSRLDSINYGFRDISASGLGLERIADSTSEFYILDDPNKALEYLDSVISQVKTEWADLGSFMANNLETQTENLQNQLVSLAEQKSTIADVDEAYATTRITKLQILQEANISALSVGNSAAKAMLALLPSA